MKEKTPRVRAELIVSDLLLTIYGFRNATRDPRHITGPRIIFMAAFFVFGYALLREIVEALGQGKHPPHLNDMTALAG